MQLILAIDSDPRRSEQLATLVRARLQVDLVQATSAGEGLHALRDRVPDLILTSPLLSPFDDGVLDEYLRELGAAATHVQTVRIPVLSSGPRKSSAAKRLFSLGRKKTPASSAAPDGCDPKIFADEIAHYLTRSLEERAASAKGAPVKVESQSQPVAEPVDEWGVPEALVQEFRETAQAPMPSVIEDTHVPGSILDLRAPVVHTEPPVTPTELPVLAQPMAYAAAELESVVELEPLAEPEQVADVEPEPTFESVQYAAPEPVSFVEPEPPVRAPHVVEPAATNAPAIDAPGPANAAPASGHSASFEAALAAIRAAWAKPETTTSTPAVTAAPTGPVRPLAGSGEVDLTNEVDALEDVTGADGSTPAEDDSPDDSQTPNAARKIDKARKGPDKPRGRKTHGADDRDDWGVLDPSQYEFSALVNKLEEVTDSDEATTRATNSR